MTRAGQVNASLVRWVPIHDSSLRGHPNGFSEASGNSQKGGTCIKNNDGELNHMASLPLNIFEPATVIPLQHRGHLSLAKSVCLHRRRLVGSRLKGYPNSFLWQPCSLLYHRLLQVNIERTHCVLIKLWRFPARCLSASAS